ncbi:MAG TPA: putative metal-dependent hydrolase [Pseudogracilibacillus sp.]|nr:putative metal-dependent hydrolase [Pseudogracilibacillus sp.]
MENQFPIGKLTVPEVVVEEHIKEWLEQIASYASRLRQVVDHLSEDELNRTYRKHAWNVRQLVHHIADSQLNMYQRLKLALTDDNPTVPNFIQDKWAIQADTELPPESSIRMLEGINSRIVALCQRLSGDQLNRTFIHEKNGRISVATKIAKLCWHEEHHLAHIKIALNK